MGRKRKGLPIHGWLVVDKPVGPTSNDVVGKVRWLTGAAKVGHGGTLDPLASGLLPIALGEATKTVQWAMDGEKTYRFDVKWGEQTSTDDAEGEAIAASPHRPSAADIEAVLPAFIGEIDQVPPAYSAIKVAGERAYKLARRSEEVVLEPRRVVVHDIRLLDRPDSDHASFEVRCGKGTYVRALGRDIALQLGTLGHISRLRRVAVGPFREDRAVNWQVLQELAPETLLQDYLLPIETVLADIPALALTEQEARRLKNGQGVPVLPVASRSPLTDIAKGLSRGDIIQAVSDGKLIALAQIAGGEIRPVRVMNL